MSLQSAQIAYDLQLPQEYPEQRHTGDVVVGETLFTYNYGKIVSVMIDEDGTEVPYSEWNGAATLVEEADAIAYDLWINGKVQQ
jgi:ribosomal protein L21E